MAQHEIPALVQELYTIVDRLESLFPGRKFTPDGHLVGSIGEVVAAHRYSLELLPASAKTHDARASDGRLVQIKATQAKSVALRSDPEHLIVLRINKSGQTEEVYNGPGHAVWNQCGKMQKNGQRSISLFRLYKIAATVRPADRLAQSAA